MSKSLSRSEAATLVRYRVALENVESQSEITTMVGRDRKNDKHISELVRFI